MEWVCKRRRFALLLLTNQSVIFTRIPTVAKAVFMRLPTYMGRMFLLTELHINSEVVCYLLLRLSFEHNLNLYVVGAGNGPFGVIGQVC